MDIRVTHIGTATLLLDLGGLRIVTDPVLDRPAGVVAVGKNVFERALSTEHLTAPALSEGEVGDVHAVLLSHHNHCDNLDAGGVVLCRRAQRVITTKPAASSAILDGARCVGLAPWSSTTLDHVTITAVPARHGPVGAGVLVGACIGFALTMRDFEGCMYISGDTVLFSGMLDVVKRVGPMSSAFLHGGAARFRGSWASPFRFTMNASEMRRAVDVIKPKQTLPIHVDGWSHFTEGREVFDAALQGASTTVRWLKPGVTELL